MDSSDHNQSKLDEIAEEFSAAIRRGQHPSVDSFVARYDDPSGQLRGLLASIAMIEGLKLAASDSAPSASKPLKIEQLDDYRIVREIGRGGMGVVFEAIHQSLGRRVAIKVLASGLLGDAKHLARFRREARAAARLRHTNIVPVFGVGQSNEHHYYVMDYIDGMSLREWLTGVSGTNREEFPTIDAAVADTDGDLGFATAVEGDSRGPDFVDAPHAEIALDTADYFRWVASRAATVCDALEYAHSQGVLHRDIKPANLLVDRHGGVWIADFGLAKLTEQQAVTMTGDIVGTPQYMPPESFEGTYDVKSEIYAVGLTLYELLTRTPAIEGKGPADVIRKATRGVIQSPRKLNPRLPRDLETIVQKSLAHDPRSRYISAGELRDDLNRFLSDRPIAARRTNLVERTVRWSRREPTVAMLTFATFALLLALAIVSAVGYLRTKDLLDVAQAANRSSERSLQQRTEALEIADQQRVRAEKNLQVALSAFDEIMQNIGDRGIESDAEFLGEVTDTTSPNVTPEDARLLQSLLGFFDQLAANNSEELLAESAVAARRAGDIYLRLGQLQRADQAYGDALDRYRKLSQRNEDEDLASTIAQAQIMNELVVITGLRGDLSRSYELFDQTLQLLKESSTAMTTEAGRFEYARAHRLFASRGARTGLDAATSTPSRRPAAGSRQGTVRRPLATMMRMRTEDELDAVAEAISTLESLIDQSPEEVRYRAELARAYRDKANVASRAKRKSESEQSVKKSIELFNQLLVENRQSEAIRYELALTLSSAEAFGFNQMMRAIRATELSSELLTSSPDLPRYQALRAHTLETLAASQQRTGRLEPAERHLHDALRIYNDLTAQSPSISLYETRRSQTLESIADLKLRQGDSAAAIEYLERAMRRLQPRTRRGDTSPVARIQLQRIRQKLARIKQPRS